jgi:hypothetical protein
VLVSEADLPAVIAALGGRARTADAVAPVEPQ